MKKEEFRQIVRIMDVDVDGNKSIYLALKKVKGISFSFANAICNLMGIDRKRKVGTFSEEEIEEIEKLIKNPKGIPKWLYNRRKDYDTGEDKHLVSSDVDLQKEFDIKRLKKIKCYRGMRHALGLPVRGQRTKSHFRKGRTLGVMKKGVKRK